MQKFDDKEIKLLELFSSTHYFGSMRDKWEEMIIHAESCLAAYMTKLAPNYRSRSLPDQPDIVWGQRVLPNFRSTLEQLNKAFILLTHGDSDALGYSDNVRSDFKGQLDYSPDWMSKKDQKIYDENMYRAMTMAHNISITEHARWDAIELSSHVEEFEEFPALSSPSHYRINRSVHVRSGEKIRVTGIYVPNVEKCCAQFLGNHLEMAPLTNVWIGTEDLLDPRTGEKYDEQKIFKEADCTWYLIEHSDDGLTSNANSGWTYQSVRVVEGEKCPKTGFYFTPAHPDSRKRFIEGEILPSLHSMYGQTIWQWDDIQ